VVAPAKTLIHIRDDFAKSLFLRLARLARPVAAGILALALLTPLVTELLALEGSGMTCSMSCCKSSKSCSCCRRSGHAPQPAGRRWTGETPCPKDCAQFTVLPGSPAIGPSEARFTAHPASSASPLPRASWTGWKRSAVAAALFQRPPPSLDSLHHVVGNREQMRRDL